MLLIGGAAWWSANRSAETFQQVDHTYQLLDQLEAGLTDMLNMQTATRGYLLTGDQRFLEPYQLGSARIEQSLRTLRSLTADNPAQTERLGRLEADMAGAITIMRQLIARRGTTDSTDGLTEVLLAGKKRSDQVRSLVAEMMAEERRLLTTRSTRAEFEQRRAVVVFGFGSLLGIGLVVTAGLMVRRDFFQRVRAEAERDRFFNLSLDLLCIASADGYFKRVSPAVTDTLGWTEAEFLRQPYLEQVHPDDQAATLETVERQVARGEKVLQFENRYRHKDGSWRTLSWRSMPHGNLMYAIARDVTKEKAAEAALRASEAEYRTLFESIDEGFCIIEVLFGAENRATDYRFLQVNPAFAKHTGMAGAQGRTMRELAPEIESYWFETFGRIVLTGEPARFQNHAGQLHRWFDVFAFRYGDPAARQVAIIFRNITERKQQEEQIRRLNADLQQRATLLEVTNKELEAFSYSVSHDLRAPLRHIDGFANLLQKNSTGRLDDQGRRHLATISDSARQMGRLIDDLLSFSRMGRAVLQPREVADHDALVASVIQEGRWERPDRPIAWQIASLPPVRADRALLQQVWANLLENAVKYSGKVAAPQIEIGSHAAPATGELVFFVRDNGAGFDMRYADKLFGVFQRLHGPAEFEGTGIGLANVHRIILRHGGRTWAEGAINRGATFYFSLPAHPTPAAA